MILQNLKETLEKYTRKKELFDKFFQFANEEPWPE
jgi:benzoyl-CoA reductase/2-hydroxyglutaryl-CoA dehydratase subunit BcrC/BadD/HgdB